MLDQAPSAALREQGLRAAVEEVIEPKTPVPLRVMIPGTRWPARVEAAAYFIISEALANVVKHSRARSAEVSARQDAGHLIVVITDDGDGGAVPGAGSGLHGMEDRAAALGSSGTVEIDSPAGHGTRITACLPMEPP
jgi:signal transduction histidine kinase